MTGEMGGEETTPIYAVRLTNAARREISREKDRLTSLSDIAVAQDWQAGILDAVRGLATYPERCIIASENDLFQRVSPDDTLRLLQYRRRRSSPAWRILFSIHEADDNDQPTVRVHHIRHAAQAPMTEWPAEDE